MDVDELAEKVVILERQVRELVGAMQALSDYLKMKAELERAIAAGMVVTDTELVGISLTYKPH